MKEIKLKTQPKWLVRMFILIGVILGGVFAFISHPMGTTRANNADGTSDFMHYETVDGIDTISICDSSDNSKCITIMDRNLGAGTNDITSTGSYGFHYQWGNNYGFVNPGVNGSDIITSDAIAEVISTTGYGPQNYFNSGVFRKMTINPFDWSSPQNDNLRGGTGDVQANNFGYPIEDSSDRQGPCPDGYHVPSQGEWGMLLQYWTDNYKKIDMYSMSSYGSAPLRYFYSSTALTQFKKDFMVPFAGYRYVSDALVDKVGNSAYFWSSSPQVGNNNARYFTLDSRRAYANYTCGRAYGLSLRCFKNSSLSFSPNLVVKDGAEIVWSREVDSGSRISEIGDLMILLEQDRVKTGYTFLGWYYENGDDIDFQNIISKNTMIVAKYRGNYVHDVDVDGIGTISICDPSSNGEICITMMDKNLGASKSGTLCSSDDTGACGNHYQWGNNYGFDPFTTPMTSKNSVDCRGYTNGRFYSSGTFIKDLVWCNPRNDFMWGAQNISQINNFGYPVMNPKDRQGPCPDGYHVTNIGERGMLLKYWAEYYKGAGNDLTIQGTEPLYKFFGNTIAAGQFQEDFKIPLAGYRDYSSANVVSMGERGLYRSSSAYREDYSGVYDNSRMLLLLLDRVITTYDYRTNGYSIRCFKDDYLSFPPLLFQVVVKDGEVLVWSGNVESGSLLPDEVIVTLNAYANTWTGYGFSGWYDNEANIRWLSDTIVETGLILQAVWTINEYTITFVDGSGEKESIVWTGEYGSNVPVEYPSWTRNGYMLSWSREIPDVVPAENIVITAIWTKKQSGGNGGGGGGGGISLKKDNCPDGDYSDSYYDGTCGKKPNEKDDEKDSSADPQNDTGTAENDNNKHNSADEIVYDTLTFNPHYSDEMNKAYQYSYHYGITTKNNIRDAAVNQQLTRIAMAKMLSQYAVNVLGIKPDATRNNEFADVSDKLDTEYGDGVTLAYQLGIMGINMPNNKFRPYGYVTRAEFATALSRLLYKTSDGEYEKTSKYYVPHINKLSYEGILTNTDPYMKELRGYVMLMLMRSAK